MNHKKAINVFLISTFIAAIFSPAITQIAVDLGNRQSPQFLDLFRQKPTEANLRAFETDMENTSYVSQVVRPWMQHIRFILLKDSGPKSLMGRRNWFFYKPGIRYLIEALPSVVPDQDSKNDVISAIVCFRDQLAERGIKLLVVPAPGKAGIYPEMLTTHADRFKIAEESHTRKIISTLKEAGVEVVDLFEVFNNARSEQSSDEKVEYFLSQDTHWSPDGVSLAASAVASRILELGWIKTGNVNYNLKPITISRLGDVIGMINVPQIERLFTSETIHCYQVINHNSNQPYNDVPDSEILVLGDSFLRIYQTDEPGSAGFIAHLAQKLKFPLTSIVNDGGATTLVRQQLSRKPELLKNKKLVIWEFVERDIRFGTEGWQNIPLPVFEPNGN